MYGTNCLYTERSFRNEFLSLKYWKVFFSYENSLLKMQSVHGRSMYRWFTLDLRYKFYIDKYIVNLTVNYVEIGI